MLEGRRCWRALRTALGCLLLWPVLAGAQVTELRQADATVWVGEQVSTQVVQLPYHWDRHNPRQAGSASFTMSFSLPALPVVPWGIYLPRLGNAYEVWLNGTLVQNEGDMAAPNGADFGQIPRFVHLNAGLLQPDNELRVVVRADIGRRGGLAPVWIGPEAAVESMYLDAYHWRVTGSMFVVGFSFVVGLLSLSLWATQVDLADPGQARRDPLYLYAGLAELFWTVRVGDVLIENPLLPWPWWGAVPVVALGGWALTMGLFCLQVTDWRDRPVGRRFRIGLWLLALLALPAALSALGLGAPLALTGWYASMGVVFIGFLAIMIWRAFGPVSWAHRAVALAMLLNVLVGLRDLYVFRINPSYASNSLMRYSSLVFGLALAAIVIVRFRQVSAHARELMNTLTVRIREKELELATSYQRLERMAREQERTAERTRILRDMHDGVGAHISSAIRQLQSGRASPKDLLATLRDSLDQLKLSIDAMNLPAGDVTAMLANLRYRLEPRLQTSDIALRWAVELLKPIERLDAAALRQLQFMVFEALSNVLQHAQATELRIEAVALDAGARLRIVDNGLGFDADTPRRRGLLSMQERARAIGANLTLLSEPGRTVVEIVL